MYDGGISIETYSAGEGKDVASMVDNEQLPTLLRPFRRSSLTRQVASLTRPKAILDESDSP